MATADFPTGPRGMDPLVPRPLDRPHRIDLAQPDLQAMDEGKIFVAPDDPADWPQWREILREWRADARRRLGIDTSRYDDPAGAWATRCYSVAQIWLWDELLFDFTEQRFTPERLLQDARDRFGGFDGVVLWHAYPIIGIDDRNQWDYYRLVPGLNEVIKALQDAGVAVFVDYNPWDTGTRRAEDDLAELTSLIADVGADGVFLDTLKEGDPALVTALEEARPGIGLESESKLPLARVAEHSLSWAQWFADSDVPGVLKTHWFEPRHQQHHIRRWHRDHSAELQSAFINGVGVMVWEVVFGVWVGWNDRDAATVRRMLAIERACSDILINGEWTPLVELGSDAFAAGVYGSAFSLDGVTVYAMINRSDQHYGGPLDLPIEEGRRVDLTEGVAAHGIGAVVTMADDRPIPEWLGRLRETLATTDDSADSRFPYRDSIRVIPPTSSGAPAADGIRVPSGRHRLTVRYRMRETGIYDDAPYVNEWKPLPPRLHDLRTLDRVVDVDHDVVVGAAEVTLGEFRAFVDAADYRPVVDHLFLAGGDDTLRQALGSDDDPVTFVDLDDARAYAAFVGARLPTEDEWQIAAKSSVLPFHRSRRVWNWTESEHSDGRTRYVQLKGGSDYLAEGSEWYFDGGPQTPDVTAKYLLPGLGLARSRQIGFRLAWDLDREKGRS